MSLNPRSVHLVLAASAGMVPSGRVELCAELFPLSFASFVARVDASRTGNWVLPCGLFPG